MSLIFYIVVLIAFYAIGAWMDRQVGPAVKNLKDRLETAAAIVCSILSILIVQWIINYCVGV